MCLNLYGNCNIFQLYNSHYTLIWVFAIRVWHDKSFCALQVSRKNSISYKIACASFAGSEQPAHPSGLIRVFAVCLKTRLDF